MNPPRIKVLPAALANQIAAGEVVERPASVVKELVENALDAGARRIEIEIEGGGRTLLRVVDDGSGMTAEEAHLALQRHATSKLASVEELFALSTMGFRGEALPSIASVSRLTLVTRAEGSDEGYRLGVEGGVEGEGVAAGAPRGTRIEVRDLLFNVPARLKFLKAEATEAAHVADAVVRLALGYVRVHFTLRVNGRVQIDLPPHPSLLERARAALGKRGASGQAGAQLHPTNHEESGIAVAACLGAPNESGTTSRNCYLLVNGRVVRDRALLQAAAMGYGALLERGRFPLAVVHVTVPPADVDVNVHPQKAEVRFARPQEVAAAVRHAVAQACAQAPWLAAPPSDAVRIYALPPEQPLRAAEHEAGFAEQRERIRGALGLFGARPPSAANFETAIAKRAVAAPGGDAAESEEAPVPPPVARSASGFFSSLVYLGQLQKTYLVCEAEGELVLIDQHAAHERVAFERLRAAHRDRSIPTQRLLFPAALTFSDPQAAAAAEHAALLLTLGFELEPFGGQSFAVKAVPEALSEAPLPELLGELLDELAHGTGAAAAGGSDVMASHLEGVLATMACHSVVRAGDVLDARKARALLDTMDGVDFRAHCPHGRPVLLRMSLAEIERKFGRT